MVLKNIKSKDKEKSYEQLPFAVRQNLHSGHKGLCKKSISNQKNSRSQEDQRLPE